MIPVSGNQSSSHLLLDLPARFFQSTSFSFTDYTVTSTLSVIDITRIKCDHSVHRFHTLGPTFENSCIHLLNCLGTTHTLAQINGRSLVQLFHSNLQAWPSRHQFCRPYRHPLPFQKTFLVLVVSQLWCATTHCMSSTSCCWDSSHLSPTLIIPRCDFPFLMVIS